MKSSRCLGYSNTNNCEDRAFVSVQINRDIFQSFNLFNLFKWYKNNIFVFYKFYPILMPTYAGTNRLDHRKTCSMSSSSSKVMFDNGKYIGSTTSQVDGSSVAGEFLEIKLS